MVDDPLKSKITLRHLATHTSGIEDAELAVDDPAYDAHHMELPGWKGIFWRGTSDKHMKTWTWADWTFAEFGHPSFVNFGCNYAEARDDYVYITSHDNGSA